MAVDGIYGFLGQRYVMAPGTIIRIGNIPGANAANIKIDTAGGTLGTLEISGLTQQLGGFTVMSGAATIVGSTLGPTFGNGYPVSINEIVGANLSGSVYLYCSGATTTVAVAWGRSQGFEGI